MAKVNSFNGKIHYFFLIRTSWGQISWEGFEYYWEFLRCCSCTPAISAPSSWTHSEPSIPSPPAHQDTSPDQSWRHWSTSASHWSSSPSTPSPQGPHKSTQPTSRVDSPRRRTARRSPSWPVRASAQWVDFLGSRLQAYWRGERGWRSGEDCWRAGNWEEKSRRRMSQGTELLRTRFWATRQSWRRVGTARIPLTRWRTRGGERGRENRLWESEKRQERWRWFCCGGGGGGGLVKNLGGLLRGLLCRSLWRSW